MAGKCRPLPSGPIHPPHHYVPEEACLPPPHPPSEGGIVFGGSFLLLSTFDQRVDVTVTPLVQTWQLLFVKHGTFPYLEEMIGMGKSQSPAPSSGQGQLPEVSDILPGASPELPSATRRDSGGNTRCDSHRPKKMFGGRRPLAHTTVYMFNLLTASRLRVIQDNQDNRSIRSQKLKPFRCGTKWLT